MGSREGVEEGSGRKGVEERECERRSVRGSLREGV